MLTRLLALSCVLTAIAVPMAAAETPSNTDQIAAAVLAAPEDRRDGATVIGWTADGDNVVLRRGDNELVCLYSNPASERFSVACYHRDLAPFMARGRQLARDGVEAQERRRIRYEEVESGDLQVPQKARTLYVLHGAGYDATTGEVTEPFLRWVLYVPFATLESTGLPSTPVPGGPWLMDPDTAGAHIMITPPRDQ